MKITQNNKLNIIAGTCIIIAVSAICAFLLWYQCILPPAFKLGERSPIKLVSIEEKTILDLESTEEEREKAKNEAINKFLEKPNLTRNDNQNAQSLSSLNNFLQELEDFFAFREKHYSALQLSLLPEEKWQIEAQQAYTELEHKFKTKSAVKQEIEKIKNKKEFSAKLKNFIVKNHFYNFSYSSWKKLKNQILPLSKNILDYGYLGTIEINSLKKISSLSQPEEALFLKMLLEENLKPNLKIQLENLDLIEKNIALNIEPVWRTLPANSVILKPGELITRDKFAIIEQLNLNQAEPNWKVFQEGFWMTLLVTISFWLYVKLEKFQLGFRQVLLLCFLMIVASAFVGFFAYKKPTTLPLAAVAIITGLFFKPTVGFSAGTLFGILCLQALGINATLALPAFVGVIVGTFLSQKAKNRADLARAGLWLGFSQIMAFLIIALLSQGIPFSVSEIILQGLSGLITALIVSSFMPYLESLFGVITRFRLLELSDSNQPLLQKLHDEAPGTYEHTLVVADLAQDAAKKIEADYELVRVGILYHDIGKLYDPQIFIENQFGGENPHEKMTPKESAQAIIAHVPEGVSLAQKYGLPEPIIYFIPAHQGTSRAGHFFLKACQQNPALKDDIGFRYPGPKPNSKETGIAMLADTVEATIRSLKTSDTNLVKETIQNLIEARIQDGQISDSTLTKEELHKIAESFLESWKNKNHERVRYISDLKK